MADDRGGTSRKTQDFWLDGLGDRKWGWILGLSTVARSWSRAGSG